MPQEVDGLQLNKVERYTNEEMEVIIDDFIYSKFDKVEKLSVEYPIGDRSRKSGLKIIYIIENYKYIFWYTDYSIGLTCYFNEQYISIRDAIHNFNEQNIIFFLPLLQSMEKQYEILSNYVKENQ